MSSVYEIGNDIARRTKNREGLPPIVFNSEDIAWVASLDWNQECYRLGQYGEEKIPACINHPKKVSEDPEKYPPALAALQGCFLPEDHGDDDRRPVYIPAMERAKDLAHRWGRRGVFAVANGNRPTREECEAARKKLEHTYRARIEMSDEEWRKTGSVRTTISNAPIALQYFGLERDWAERAGEQDICPYCNRSVKSKAVKCGNNNCGAILDWKRAYEGGIVTKDQAEEHGVVFAAAPTPAPKRAAKHEDVEL